MILDMWDFTWGSPAIKSTAAAWGHAAQLLLEMPQMGEHMMVNVEVSRPSQSVEMEQSGLLGSRARLYAHP
jgi:hypothetical protein